jgi:hypothetical protein
LDLLHNGTSDSHPWPQKQWKPHNIALIPYSILNI